MADFKLSTRDWQQTLNYSHDEQNNATRVNVIAADGLTESIKEGLKDLKVEVKPMSNDIKLQIIEVPKIITETKVEIVEVPKIITKTEYEVIENTVVVKEFEIREVEKIVYIPEIKYVDKIISLEKETKIEDNKKLSNYILIIQTILMGLIALKLFL